ncbi:MULTISPECIES: hypothetical protein [unclassified Bradyrhizobium]|uniref:hypothetical protein n=1 Tax=unclassified Bradyrhizobium TaxID=2631580 RepID=UPI001FF90511|nr:MULTISPECIES: hypothetical protein [unclassified Bradyrhizobium]MCK1319606.1 hypothetical protein [Bradyrhizobium sp. 156]UPJ96274.1 hypothetical protein IVB07_01475 [Bradyrhizobium sp. 172]
MSDIENQADRIALADAIGKVCTFDDMDVLLRICFGEGVIKEVPPSDRPSAFVLNCLDWADRRGIETNLVALVLRYRSDSDEGSTKLRKLVERIMPAALHAEPSVSDKVDAVVAQLDRIRSSLSASQLNQLVRSSSSVLNEAIEGIESLLRYKALHDALHRLQLVSRRNLLKQAKKFMTDSDSEEMLRSYNRQIDATLSTSRAEVSTLNRAQDRQIEQQWIDFLGRYGRQLETGLNKRDLGEVRVNINLIVNETDDTLGRLNDLIFAITKSLPLLKLAKQLEELRSQTSFENAVNSTPTTIRDISRILFSRVAVHNQMQLTETNMSVLAETLAHPDELVLEDFTTLWPDVKSTLKLLAGLGLLADKQLERAEDRVDACVLDIERGTSDKPELSERYLQLVASLEQAFSDLHMKTRVQFVEVDRQLKSDIEKLYGIAQSLRAIVGAVPVHLEA